MAHIVFLVYGVCAMSFDGVDTRQLWIHLRLRWKLQANSPGGKSDPQHL